jgi:NitT/TauT family transport system permease protein
MKTGWQARTLRWAIFAALVGMLELACRQDWISPQTVVAPSAMVAGALSGLQKPTLLHNLGVSAWRIAAAGLMATLGGFLLGCLLRPHQALRDVIQPFFATYYAVPIVIFYPLLTLIVGYGSLPIIAIGVAMGMVAMITATLEAFDRVPRVLAKVALAHGLGWWATVLRVRLPSAAPDLFSGLKVTIGYAVVGVVASEFLLASEGIGHVIQDYYNGFRTRDMYGAILVLVTCVLALSYVLRRGEERVRRYRKVGFA